MTGMVLQNGVDCVGWQLKSFFRHCRESPKRNWLKIPCWTCSEWAGGCILENREKKMGFLCLRGRGAQGIFHVNILWK
jgi:hypothetical protein